MLTYPDIYTNKAKNMEKIFLFFSKKGQSEN